MKSRFNDQEIQLLFTFIEELTGTCQEGRFRKEILGKNIIRRMDELKIKSLSDYLRFAQEDKAEGKILISSLTIHTTFWFRESPHYDALAEHAMSFAQSGIHGVYRFWSAACSTGEELYSAGLILEMVRRKHPAFEYELYGTDIDPISVETGLKALYRADAFQQIPGEYHSLVLVGTGRAEGWFTLSPEIRKRTKFTTNNLSASNWAVSALKFDWIMCRNVLIYFSETTAFKIVERLFEHITPEGRLCLGHSEILSQLPKGMAFVGTSCYSRAKSQRIELQKPKSQRKVLVIDDSKVIRRILRALFEKNGYLVDEAESASVATSLITATTYDLLTLDLHMPVEDGDVWLHRMRKAGFTAPVIIVSDADPKEAEGVLAALEGGAQDYISKSALRESPEELILEANSLTERKEIPGNGNSGLGDILPQDTKLFFPEVILIGASTGGPAALTKLLNDLPASECPPILVVQHINAAFAHPMAQRLSRISGLPLAEPINAHPLKAGHLYMAWKDQHIGVIRSGGLLLLSMLETDKLHGHRPAVDALFQSAAIAKTRALGILMTGMGKDGAQGLLELKKMGSCLTLAQDQASSVVYGMPGEAKRLGAIHAEGSPMQIRGVMDRALMLGAKRKAA